MDNLTLEVSGYVVTFHPALNFGQKRRLKKLMASGMTINAETNKRNTDVSGALVIEAQDAVLEMLIASLKTPTGAYYVGPEAYKAVQELSDESVGEAIYARVDEITAATTLTEDDKKK